MPLNLNESERRMAACVIRAMRGMAQYEAGAISSEVEEFLRENGSAARIVPQDVPHLLDNEVQEVVRFLLEPQAATVTVAQVFSAGPLKGIEPGVSLDDLTRLVDEHASAEKTYAKDGYGESTGDTALPCVETIAVEGSDGDLYSFEYRAVPCRTRGASAAALIGEEIERTQKVLAAQPNRSPVRKELLRKLLRLQELYERLVPPENSAAPQESPTEEADA